MLPRSLTVTVVGASAPYVWLGIVVPDTDSVSLPSPQSTVHAAPDDVVTFPLPVSVFPARPSIAKEIVEATSMFLQ